MDEIIAMIIEDIKTRSWTVPQKRSEIVTRLKSSSDEIDRKIITEIRSFRPLGTLSEFGAAMGAEPRKGMRIDTLMGATIFDEKRVPAKERVDRWEAEHKEAERIRGLIPEYAFGLDARPNTVTGNFRIVEHARRLKEQGLLSQEEERILNALEKYWQEHPEFDREKGYGVWAYNLEIMVPERLQAKSTPKQPWEMTSKEFYSQEYWYDPKRGRHPASGSGRLPTKEVPYFEAVSIGGKQQWKVYNPYTKEEVYYKIADVEKAKAHYKNLHMETIKKALEEGKPIPSEVLKEYPDMLIKKKEPWEMT
jgi:hypothetical protein